MPLTFAALLAAPVLGVTASPEAGGSLRVVTDWPLGEGARNAVDARWASDHSVYLAMKRSGAVEYDLRKGGPGPKELIPGEKKPGGLWLSWNIAATTHELVVAAPAFALTWRSLDSPVRKEEPFEFVVDLDAHGQRVAVLGARRDDAGKFSPNGAIAWVGSLDKRLADLKPLLFDAGGPEAPNMAKCAFCFLGATRFLADGSLVVVPGVQPGAFEFDPSGKLVKTIDTVALGIDTDCSSVTAAQKSSLGRHTTERMAWVNSRRILDEVLPLPTGLGFLIRSLEKGQVRWTLKVVRPDGAIASYSVPIHGQSAHAHLKGDVRDGRILLLLWEYAPDGGPEGAPPPHLYQLAMP